MPTVTARSRARRDARSGKKTSTQAGEYVREELRQLKTGRGTAKSRQQAVAIGLSEARRDGVPLPAPARGRTSTATRRKAKADQAVGAARRRSEARPRASKRLARIRDDRDRSGHNPRVLLQ